MNNLWGMDLTDEKWTRLDPLIPSLHSRSDPRDHPVRNPRDILNGILWILGTFVPWKDKPERFPPYQTCHRWFQKWSKNKVVEEILVILAANLLERGGIDIREAFIDGSFDPAKKGVRSWED